MADKDLRVFPEECLSQRCSGVSSCSERGCELCRHCVSSEEAESLRAAFLEHANRHQARRILPRPVTREEAAGWRTKRYPEGETEANRKMDQWFMGKCLAESRWCG